MRTEAILLIRANCFEKWWPGTELNRRRQPFQGCALPPELPGHAVRKRCLPETRASPDLLRQRLVDLATATGGYAECEPPDYKQSIGFCPTAQTRAHFKFSRRQKRLSSSRRAGFAPGATGPDPVPAGLLDLCSNQSAPPTA